MFCYLHCFHSITLKLIYIKVWSLLFTKHHKLSTAFLWSSPSNHCPLPNNTIVYQPIITSPPLNTIIGPQICSILPLLLLLSRALPPPCSTHHIMKMALCPSLKKKATSYKEEKCYILVTKKDIVHCNARKHRSE